MSFVEKITARMRDRTDGEALGRQTVIGVSILLALVVVLLVIAPLLPDGKPAALQRELEKGGYDVQDVSFAYVRDGDGYREWIYQSSEPILYEGQYVSQWSLFSYSFSSFMVHYAARPYPALPEPVQVQLTFTPEEFESITQGANGQDIEEYIKKVLHTVPDDVK